MSFCIFGYKKGQPTEQIIKPGKDIKLSKQEIKETELEKTGYYTKQEIKKFKQNNKGTYTQIEGKPLYWNSKTRPCTTRGTVLFNPKSSIGKVKETNGKTINHKTKHDIKYCDNKPHNPSTLAMSWRK